MATNVFITKQLPLEYFDTRQVGIRYLNVLQKYAKLMKADYERTTETWERHHPVFEHKVGFAGANIDLLVWTNDGVYFEIDEGATRYVRMSKEFVPKTRPGVLRSFPGNPGEAIPTRTPRDIEPRLFSVTITRKYEKDVISDIYEATRIGIEARKNKP